MQEQQKGRRQLLINNIRSSMTKMPVLTSKRTGLMTKCENRKKTLLGFSNQNQFSQSQDQESPQNLLEDKEHFLEKYELLDKIGEGANGVVKKCRHKQKKTIYAVKVIKLSRQHCLQLKKNFRFMKGLFHKNIISYHALYLDLPKSKCYLVMDYLQMPSLEKAKNLTQEEIKQIMKQLFSVLEYLHSKNICHRDIKPDNILYDRSLQKIKLIDFGISRKVVEREQKKELLTMTGTLYYRAPQMFLMGGYDESVDIWAAGVTLYKLIVGKTPFESEYVSETIQKIRQNKVQFDEQKWSKYDYLAKDLVLRLLTKSKKDRLTAQQGKGHFWLKEKEENIDIYRSDTFQYELKKLSMHKMNTQTEEKREEPIITINNKKNFSFTEIHQESREHSVWTLSDNEDMIVQVTEEGDQLFSPSTLMPMRMRASDAPLTPKT